MSDDEVTAELPTATPIEVKCAVCDWPLRNLGYKWEHIQPLAPDDHHKPEPVA